MNVILEQINSVGLKFVEFALPMFVQSVVMIVILLLADFVLRKKICAVFRYWIWLLVLVKLVLPTSLSSPLSLGYFFGDRLTYVDTSETPLEPQVSLAEPAPVNVPPFIDLTDIETDKFTPVTRPIIPVAEPAVTNPADTPVISVTPLSWQGAVFLTWLTVVMAMVLLLLQRVIFVRGLVVQAKEANGVMAETLESCRNSMSVRRKLGLKISANAASPAVCGLFRPVILVPQNLASSLTTDQLRAVLLHELAHIRRGDLFVNFAQTVLQIIYFYNPLLWLANCIIHRIREQAVDEMVLVAMGEKAQQYPQTLVSVAKLAFKRPVLSLRLIGVVESKSALSGRIKHILNRPMPKKAKLGIIGLFVVIIAGAILLPMEKADKEVHRPEISPPTMKLEARSLYTRDEPILLYLSWRDNGWVQTTDNRVPENEGKWILFLRVNGADYCQGEYPILVPRYITAGVVEQGRNFDAREVNNPNAKPIKFPPGRYQVSYIYKDVSAVRPDQPEQIVSFGDIATNEIEFEVLDSDVAIDEPKFSAALLNGVKVELIAKLVEKLKSKDDTVWKPAAEQLKKIGPKVARQVAELFGTATGDLHAVRVLESMATDEHVQDVMVQGLSADPHLTNSNVRHCSLIILSKSGNRGHVKRIIPLLRKDVENGEDYSMAEIALAELGGDDAYNALVETVTKDIPDQMRWMIAEHLAGMGRVEAIPHLKDTLKLVDPSHPSAGARIVEAIHRLENKNEIDKKPYTNGDHTFTLHDFDSGYSQRGILYAYDLQRADSSSVYVDKLPAGANAEETMSGNLRALATGSKGDLIFERVGEQARLQAYHGTLLAPLEVKTEPPHHYWTDAVYKMHQSELKQLVLDYNNKHAKGIAGPIPGFRLYPFDEGDLFAVVLPSGQIAILATKKIVSNTNGVRLRVLYLDSLLALVGTGRIEASQGSTADADKSQFIATLPNGVTVELIGICEHPSEGKHWWRPDGSKLGQRPFEKLYARLNAMREVYELALKIENPQNRQLSIIGKNGHVFNVHSGKIWGGYVFSEGKKILNQSIGIAHGPWETIARAYPKLTQIVGDFAFGEAFESNVEGIGAAVGVTVTHTIGEEKVDCRVIAVDRKNNIHTSSGHSGMGGSSWMQTTVHFKDFQIDEIKEFQFQTRPYQWVNFKNVSLKPNFKTDVQVELGNTDTIDWVIEDYGQTRLLSDKEKPKTDNWVSIWSSAIKNKGRYLVPDRGLTLKDLIKAAGYNRDKLAQSYVELIRRSQQGNITARSTYSRNLKTLLSGEESDIVIKPHDAVAGGYIEPSANGVEFWSGYHFGEVVELTVNDDGAKINMFADFDSGELITLPDTLDFDEENAVLRWIKENGIDVMGETASIVHGLIGFNMYATRVDNYLWDASPQEITDRLMVRIDDPVLLSVENLLPVTYLIKTSEYKMGILQILGFTENPKGIKIRYKLLNKEAAPKPDVRTAPEPVSGDWQYIGQAIVPDFNDTMILTEHVNLGSIGRDAEGKTFITLFRDREKTKDHQYRFVLFNKAGNILEPDGHIVLGESKRLEEKFTFDEPFLTRRLKGFRFQARPLPPTGIDNISSQLQKPSSEVFEGETLLPSDLAPPGRYAVELDGVDDYLLVPDNPSLRLEPPFTIEMWIKTKLPPDASEYRGGWALMSKGFTVGTPRAYLTGFGINLDRRPNKPSQLYIDYCKANHSGTYSATYAGYPLTNGTSEWLHITHVFEGKYYKSTPGHPLVMGKFLIPTNNPFKGLLGEVRLWNGARTRQELSQYKNVALTGTEPGLAACWTFEQTEGRFAYDISSNNNHARLGKFTGSDDADPKWIDLQSPSPQPDQKTNTEMDETIAKEKVSSFIGCDLPASVQDVKSFSSSTMGVIKVLIRFDIPLSDLKGLLTKSDKLPDFPDLQKNPKIHMDMVKILKVHATDWWKLDELESPICAGWRKSKRAMEDPMVWRYRFLRICCSQEDNNLIRVYIMLDFFAEHDDYVFFLNPDMKREIEKPKVWSQKLAGDVFAAIRANDNNSLKALNIDEGFLAGLEGYRREYDFSGLNSMVNYQKTDRCFVIVSPVRHKEGKYSDQEIRIGFKLEQGIWEAGSIERGNIWDRDDFLKKEGFEVFSRIYLYKNIYRQDANKSDQQAEIK